MVKMNSNYLWWIVCTPLPQADGVTAAAGLSGSPDRPLPLPPRPLDGVAVATGIEEDVGLGAVLTLRAMGARLIFLSSPGVTTL